MRFVHLFVICALIFAAAYVYRIKMESTVRLQDLATRHLSLRPLQATQYDSLKNLPPRPPRLVPPGDPDPIRTIIESVDQEALAGAADDTATGSIPAPEAAQ